MESDPRETFAFRRLVELYRERDGDVDGFISELRAAVEADADAYTPRMLLGHLLKAQSRVDEARAVYLRAAELRPREAAPQLALAQLARTASDLPEARRRYSEALDRTRERTRREELLREAAGLAMQARDFDAARGYYSELGRGGRGSVYLRGEYARALATAREWDLAIVEYQRVLRSLRGDNRVLPPILLELSRAQLETGTADASIETLDRALRAAGRQAGIRAEIYEQMRTAYRRTDRLPELAERLRRERGGGYEASSLLAHIEDELGNDDAALEAFRRALRARPRDIEARRSIIQILMLNGRLEEVVTEYRALIRSAPREPRFVIELAQHLMQTDRRDEALRLVRDTGRRHPRDAVLHDQLARLYAHWGEEELVSREVELLARIDPHDPAHVIALGTQQFSTGDTDAAIATWRRVLEVDSDRARGHATLAGILADHDLLPQAIEHYREAVQRAPEEITYVRGLATTLDRRGQPDLAEAEWRRVLELAGEDRVARREARERIVAIWARSGRLERRITELRRRFDADPPDAEAGRFLAEAHRRHGPQHQGQAERVLARIVEADPSDVESLLALERILRHRGDLDGAIATLRRLRDADPRRASRYLSRMAEHALALYRDEEAVRYAAEAVERNPDDASAHRRLADLYRARQDIDRAIQSYRRALELNDRLHPVYFQLAELHLARGEIEDGDRLFRQVLAITPDDDLVARAARASIQINLGAGTLPTLERDLLPLALGHPERPVFRRMAVELYDAYAAPLARRARRGEGDVSQARTELRQVGARAIKPLLEALADQDPAQRRVALDILGDLGNPNAAAPLLAAAENPELEVRERIQALTAAGSLAQPSLAPRFLALADGDDARLSGLATWALARLRERGTERALTRLARSTDAPVRAYAAMALGLAGGRANRLELTRRLREDPSEDVRFAAAWALGHAGTDDEVEPLIELMQTHGGRLGRVAAEALGEIGGTRAREALLRALFDTDPDLRASAGRALRRLVSSEEHEEATLGPPLVFEHVRDHVLRLSERREETPPPDLEALRPELESAARAALAGPQPQVLAALGLLGGDTSRVESALSLGELTADLPTWPVEQARSAEESLSALADGLMAQFIVASRNPDAAVRVAAIQILVRFERDDAAAAIADALSGPLSVQRATLEALGRAGRPPNAPLAARLAQLLSSHRDWSIRTRAAGTLARSGSDAARQALRDALRRDPYAFVREAAAEALAGAAAPQDRAALTRASREDDEPRVRAAAARALASDP